MCPAVLARSSLQLYFSPGSCSRVSLIALEEAGVEYAGHQVLLSSGEQHAAAFRALNPKGRVPVLVVGDQVLSETVAIVSFLAWRFPQADLLPRDDPWAEAQALSFLAWCASTLHPLLTRLRLPQRFCDRPDSAGRVRDLAREEMVAQLTLVEELLSQRTWMLGSAWSIVDAYVFWVWARCPESGIDASLFPCLSAHGQRSMARPAVQRAIARETRPPGR